MEEFLSVCDQSSNPATLFKQLSNYYRRELRNIRTVRELNERTCVAQTSNGMQCCRRVADLLTDFCRCHQRIGAGTMKFSGTVNRKRQASAAASMTEVDFSKIDLSEYIKTRPVEIKRQQYLMSQNRTLFDKRDFTIIGKVDEENNITFYK